MSKETNNKVNKINQADAIKHNDKHYHIRSGKCDYVKCQSACCRFKVCGKQIKQKGIYSELNVGGEKYSLKQVNGSMFYLASFLCPHIKVEGGCELHNKPRKQPYICQHFPMLPTDGMYMIVKHVCNYKFKKVKNIKYKKKKKNL